MWIQALSFDLLSRPLCLEWLHVYGESRFWEEVFRGIAHLVGTSVDFANISWRFHDMRMVADSIGTDNLCF